MTPPRVVRVSEAGRTGLLRLKAATGVPHWNTLARLAVLRSLQEPGIPARLNLGAPSNVEMDWSTFGGDWGPVLWGLVLQRVQDDGLPLEEAQDQLRLHLHRGVGLLLAAEIRGPEDLLAP